MLSVAENNSGQHLFYSFSFASEGPQETSPAVMCSLMMNTQSCTGFWFETFRMPIKGQEGCGRFGCWMSEFWHSSHTFCSEISISPSCRRKETTGITRTSKHIIWVRPCAPRSNSRGLQRHDSGLTVEGLQAYGSRWGAERPDWPSMMISKTGVLCAWVVW